jgi:hypothetical protein
MNQHLDKLSSLDPCVRERVREFIEQVETDHHVTLAVIFTWRSVREQAHLYAQGREYDRDAHLWRITDRAAVVTHARAGNSAHNVVTVAGLPASLAADLMPMRPDGTIDWRTGYDFWNRIYLNAWEHDLDPLGDKQGEFLPGDWGHFSYPAWRTSLVALNLVLPLPEISNV